MMLKHRAFSRNLLGAILKSKVNQHESLRWTAVITADPYFDDATLRAAKPFKDIPCSKVLPVIGTGWVFLPLIGKYDSSNFGKFLLEKRKILGDVFREKLGHLNFVVTFNVDDLRTMNAHEGPYPAGLVLESIKAYRESRKQWYTTIGLGLLQGKEWLELRKKTQKHLMKPKAVMAFLNPMQDVTRDFVDKILRERDENMEVPEFLDQLRKWSLESIGLVGLDSRLGCLEANLPADSDGMKMIKSVLTTFDCINKLEAFSGNLPFWKFFPTPTWKKLTESGDTFTQIGFKLINRSLDKLKSAADEDEDLTLLQSMILKEGLDVSSAMVMVNDMMLAGIDTTSNTVGFFLYNMAKNPEEQELLYQHLKEALPRKEDRITPEIFNELRYLKACIKESQRLNPVAAGFARVADHDVIFSGYRIPAGTVLLAGIQGIFRDERYFTTPDEFLPERWLSKDEKFHPFAYLPFGFGTRSCIGRRVAELEIFCLTAEIIRNFKIEYHYEDIGIVTKPINTPDKPLRFTFVER